MDDDTALATTGDINDCQFGTLCRTSEFNDCVLCQTSQHVRHLYAGKHYHSFTCVSVVTVCRQQDGCV